MENKYFLYLGMNQEEWNALPNTGERLGNRSTQTSTQRALAPTGTFPPLSAAWAPVPQPVNWSQVYQRAEALRLEREKKARMNKIYAQLPVGANKLTNKTKTIEHYEGMLREVQAIKQLKLSNAQSIIASFITGEERGSINQQEGRIKQLLQTLRSVHQNAGTRHKRKHSKRRFRATRRKTT